jgi:beta-glucosidase
MVAGFSTKGLLLLGLLSGFTAGDASKPIYKDPSASIDDRVSDLLGRMTIEDKMAQLMQGTLNTP